MLLRGWRVVKPNPLDQEECVVRPSLSTARCALQSLLQSKLATTERNLETQVKDAQVAMETLHKQLHDAKSDAQVRDAPHEVHTHAHWYKYTHTHTHTHTHTLTHSHAHTDYCLSRVSVRKLGSCFSCEHSAQQQFHNLPEAAFTVETSASTPSSWCQLWSKKAKFVNRGYCPLESSKVPWRLVHLKLYSFLPADNCRE